MSLERALQESRDYFSEKLDKYGASPEGVDYNSSAAQTVRFDQLIKLIDPSKPFDMIDFGCGYGALFDHLLQKGWDFRYYGFDILAKMVETARSLHQAHANARFLTEQSALPACKYVIASGIFNSKFQASATEWRDHTLQVITQMHALSTGGFAFNILSSYSDVDRMAQRPDLYFADPLFYFDYCKRHYSRDAALLHDYGLYDFTIIVRKQV
jgi:SAM-dependent methyltransferase